MMAFTFLQLPPEIRNKIYRLLLITSNGAKGLTPDVIGHLARSRRTWEYRADMGDSLPLLRTCKLVNQEASSILYGGHGFNFDDEPIDADDDRTAGSPICQLMFLYPWLCLIGTQNRWRLRDIWLIFAKKNFFYCRGETNTFTSKTVTGTGGEYLVDALELLAGGHALTTMHIVLDDTMGDQEILFQHLFRRSSESRLIRQMEDFSGLEQLSLDEELNEDSLKKYCPEAYAIFRFVKLRMEMKRPVQLPRRSMVTDPSDSTSLGKKIAELEEERDRLKQEAMQMNRQLRRQVRKVEGIENTLSEIQTVLSKSQNPQSGLCETATPPKARDLAPSKQEPETGTKRIVKAVALCKKGQQF